ncbi:hydrogenase 4 subunit B [uncultured Paludibaculum sp.]|uniref:hydrogenase 4 subunit B n=1 Tax=uncultured Paludibaculum sp. TaxID=1765020 RepID=UPI002AAA794B|nr:hydrogenase 4 subunit B [uncultured Paludibaculum sp.]
MNSFPTGEIFAAGLAAYALGAVSGLFLRNTSATARRAGCGFALLGGILQGAAGLAALLGASVSWSVPSGVPLFAFGFSLDATSALFTCALSLLSASVSIYSLGYLAPMDARHNLGLLSFFYNALLLSLAVIFTASNAFLFLIAWELMALASYALVTFEHTSLESRSAGLLYLIMSHVDAGCLLLGFSLLASNARSLDFSALREAASRLPPQHQTAAFLLFFLGFGIKAGVIPLHVWLPAAHPVAPTNASALLSGIVIKTGIYGMVRVFLEFLGVVPNWMGIVVIVVAVTSAILGVLYALMEHDLKRLLAYHSIENIGIILLGLGAAMMFRTAGHPRLAAVAVIASLFHTVNHAVFKCLLFLGAGSVLHSTHTRNMEELGGLNRRMPWTSACFLVGAIAISGLPPLNGFVSEWLTYQSLLAGYGAAKGIVGLMFPIAGSLLALTGALAAACFVKAFGITFLALPRSPEAEHAQESSGTMIAGMAILAVACFGLGIGASWLLPMFDGITTQLAGAAVGRDLSLANGFVISSGAPHGGSVSTAAIAAMLIAVGAIPAWLFARRTTLRRTGPTWDCGLPGLGPENEFTATAFSKPLRMVFAALYQPRREIQAVFDISPYFPKAIHFESEIEPTFENRIYKPIQSIVYWVSSRMRAIQAGSIHLYLAYIFVTLIVLLLYTLRA